MSLIFLHRRKHELAQKGSAIYTDCCGEFEGQLGDSKRIGLIMTIPLSTVNMFSTVAFISNTAYKVIHATQDTPAQ